MDVSTDVEQSTIDKQPKQHTLPIDEFEKEILETVSKQRVTIIQGATGCGKSSRVPAMLLRAPPPPPLDSCTTPVREVKLFISQPRRIAAKSLVERVRSCEPDLKDDIALRMGHGVREYESPATRAWFVTTGYLVRLLASHPERFNDISHLVVDEVHERSVDTDVLCLLCRRLLVTNERIRLVLMSATMAATLYQQYFGVPEDPIFVGARRFPIQEYFVEDLATALSTPLPPNIERAVASIANLSAKGKCQVVPRATEMEQLYQLAVHIIMCAGRPGSSILVFVPGMSDIVSIVESVERLNVPPIRYVCYPIHSDVPFEEQLIAFDTPDANEAKVVVATNAAESSVTLPDVDVVICLGLCKQIVYNPRSHRQALECCWISRASATQRAGRTGRVREGSVYRLYPRVAFEQYMQEFEPGEMGRIPLDSVILSLKEMLKEEATPNLLQCLEPPDLSTIDRSFKSLFQSNFLTQPNDGGEITELGTFVIALGVDLMLGSLIGLGMQFGVLPEAIELGAVLSFPKSPWLMTNPLYHDPADYNDITARTFVSKCHFDAATRSEPFAIMNLLWEYEHIGNKSGWCRYYGVSAQRVRHLEATKKSIRGRVADYIGIDPTLLNVDGPPVRMHHSKLTILRVLQVWVFSAGIIECKPLYKEGADEITWPLGGATVTESHLEEVLDKERHPYELKSVQNIEQCGRFTPVEGPFTPKDFQDSFLDGFELRFVSYAIEKKFDVFWIQTDASIRVYAMSYVVASPEFDSVRNELLQKFEEARLSAVHSSSCSSQRGRRGRACGLWHVGGMDASGTDSVHFTKWTTTMPTRAKKLQKLRRLLRGIPKAESVMSCTFSRYSNSQDSPNFALFLQGNCDKVSDTDAQDLLATPHVECRTRQVNNTRQSITFHDGLQRPLPAYEGKDEAGDDVDSSWNRPLVKDIPEGARLLSVLASGRRNDHLIRLNSVEMDASADSDDMFDTASCTTFDISIPTKETKISQRWRQFGTNLGVFVSENSVPAATVAMKDPAELFACCANILELRGGNVKAEGMTLLPKGRLFVLLSLVSFGLQPAVGQGTDFDEKKEEILDMFEEDDPVTCRLLSWLHDGDIRHGMEEDDEADLDALIRINKAQKFHRSCEALGESLVCYPDKVLLLLQIFDTVDGYRTLPWDKLDESPFTAANIQKFKDEYRSKRRVSLSSKGTSETRARQVASSTYTKTNAKKNFTRKLPLKATAIDIFHPGEMASFDRLFVVDLPQGESVGENELPSTNIQCILWNYYCVNSGELRLRDDSIEFSAKYWRVWSVRDSKGCDWFKADFVNDTVPLPTQSHPKCVKDALKCVPPSISNIRMIDANVVFPGNDRSVVVLFSTVESALRMESAMWLELHFGEGDVHWYQQTLKELMEKAVALQ